MTDIHTGPALTVRDTPGLVTVTCTRHHVLATVPIDEWAGSPWDRAVQAGVTVDCNGNPLRIPSQRRPCEQCAKPIPPKSPSEWFCNDDCQRGWHKRDKNLIDFNAPSAVTLLAADVHAAQGRPSTPLPTTTG